METTIEFKNDALTTVVEQSGLEKTKGQQLLQMFTPYFNRMAEIELRINSLNKHNPSKDDSAKAKKDADDKAVAELKAKIAAEKKAAKAPDKVKLTEMINSLELKVVNLSPDSDVVFEQIAEKFIAFKKWALQQIESI